MSMQDLFAWAEGGDQGTEHVLPSAAAIVTDRSNTSPYAVTGDPVIDYASAGELVFSLFRGDLVAFGEFAFTDRAAGDRRGPRDRIAFTLGRDGSAVMTLLSWGGSRHPLEQVVVEDGPREGTFLRGYVDRDFAGAALVTMSFDRATRPRLR